LDTGSEATILPASAFNMTLIKPTLHALTAANGTEIPLLGEIILPMQIGRYNTTIKGLVSEHINEIMIGVDWMMTNQVTWEFGGKRMHVAGHRFDLKSKPIELIDVSREPSQPSRNRIAHEKEDKLDRVDEVKICEVNIVEMSGRWRSSSSGEPADTSPRFVNKYNRMLGDEVLVPSDCEEKKNLEAAQQAFFGELADDAGEFQIVSRATETAGDAAVMSDGCGST